MKKYTFRLIILATTAWILTACTRYNEVMGAKEISPLSVVVKLTLTDKKLSPKEEMIVKLDNHLEGHHLVKTFSSQSIAGESIVVDSVIPGIYTVSVSGKAYNSEGEEYFINGNVVNKALYDGSSSVEILLQGLKRSPLVFKEIYYCGSPTWYFRDQFYEIYNNSEKVQYLDDVYFAHLTPTKATTKLPLWPSEDGNNYAYAERVWRFPGSGHDYPLRPGESCVISQFAVNHKLKQYNPNSPVDCSSSEFEFYMNNPNYPDQPAINMKHVFFNGKSEIGRSPQYLTSVFGSAYVIFRIPEGQTWDPVKDPSMSTPDLSDKNATKLFAKIPISYVLDAVEAIDNESMANAKRVPAVLDAGYTWVGDTYLGLGVARKIAVDDEGNPMKGSAGALIFQDTNNSTEDFERGVVPMLRRHGTGIPAWNHNR